MRIQEEITLYHLLLSKDRNKKEEVNWRKYLIKAMEGMTFSPEGIATIKKIKDKIQEASAKKISIKELNKEYAETQSGIAGTFITKDRTKDIPIVDGTFEKYFLQLRKHLASVKSGDSKEVFDTWRESMIRQASQDERSKFGPWLDAIAAERSTLKLAKPAKGMDSMKALLAKMQEIVHEFKEKLTLVQQRQSLYMASYRHVIAMRDEIVMLANNKNTFFNKKTGEEGKAKVNTVDIKPVLSDAEKSKLSELAVRCKKLAEVYYGNPFTTDKKTGLPTEREASSDALYMVEKGMNHFLIKNIRKQQQEDIAPEAGEEIIDPETGEVTHKNAWLKRLELKYIEA
jgi:hypothetical protein